MKFSRIMSLALVISSLLLFIPGCEEKYECPEWFTGEYCSENYTVMSTNYVHSKADKKCVDKNDIVISFHCDGGDLAVYKIRGEKIEDYALGYINRLWGWHETRVIKSKTNDVDPIYDYIIESIEICGVKVEPGSREDVLNYEDACTLKVFDKTVDPDVLSDLSVSFLNHDSTRHIEDKEVLYFEYDNYSQAYNKHLTDEGKGYCILKVMLRVRFEETPNIMWEAHIIKYDGHLYLECGECDGSYQLISLNDTVRDYINSVLSSNPEIYFSQNCSLPQ